ncbi:MAG: penicillin-binding protein 2 [Thermoleophilia bacterium]
MYLEPIRKRRPPGDDPSIGVRLALLASLGLVLLSILVFRLWFLQILSGDEFVTQADNQRLRTVSIEAPRGVIYDRDGDPLVTNRAGLSVGILPMDLTSPESVLPRLATVLGIPEEDIRLRLEKAKSDPYRVVEIMSDVPENPVVSYLLEHSLEFPGVRVEKSYLRNYPRRAFATHILGYVGEVDYDDLETEQFRTLKPGDSVGKNGVEAMYDSKLRGYDGSRTIEVDATGRPKRVTKEIQPLPGSNLVLTIDNDIQEAAERAVVAGIDRARADGFADAAAGVVVALDPRTGEVLAMTSYPDYNPALWVGGMKAEDYQMLLVDPRKPLFDRAIKGQYPAASTFKPFVAATALRDDLIDYTQVFYDPGYFEIGKAPQKQTWKCWLDSGHGDVNLVEALMESCDTYFYNLGSIFYDQKGPVLQNGIREFGFGSQTGIDLGGEYSGQVPDADWKREFGTTDEEKVWKPGDEVNLSIGQGYLLVTPLQLAVAFAAIANGGDILVPRIARQITDGSGNVTKQFETETKNHVDMNAEDLDAIRRGLRLVTSDPNGTAYGAFKGFPIPVVGKTGTAEKRPDDDYAWFMGYAPADNPEILVVALIEQGGHGSSVAAPVVRSVLAEYFQLEVGGPGQIEVTE